MQYKKYLLLLILITATVKLKAQNTSADTTASRLAEKLSTTVERAKSIQDAMNYRHNEIKRLAQDRTMNALKKQQAVKRLLDERAQLIDAATTPEEKEKLLTYYSTLSTNASDKAKQLNDRNDSVMMKNGVRVNN